MTPEPPIEPTVSPTPSPPRDRRFDVFYAWVAMQKARAATSTKRRDQFSDKTGKIYESLWRGWVDWLTVRELQWHEARAEHLDQFLNGPAPAPDERRTRRPKAQGSMAEYTRQRYFSVLQQVYSYSVVNGLIEASPCTGITVKPRIPEGDQQRQVLAPGVLGLLRDAASLERLLPQEEAGYWWVLRDRAAVILAACCGLTARELIELRGQDLRDVSEHPPQPQLPGVPAPQLRPAVDIPAHGSRPARSLALPEQVLPVLRRWLAKRAQLLDEERRAFAEKRRQAAPAAPADAPILLSREAPAGQPRLAVDPQALYSSFRRCLDAAFAAAGANIAPDQYVARGPSIVRNTVIALWVAELGEDRAAELAGVKPVSLRPPGGSTRAATAAQRATEPASPHA